MYLLDTNVLSELRRGKAGRSDLRVVAWAKGVSPAELYLSVVTILELEMGVLRIERRDPAQARILRRWIRDFVLKEFADEILDINLEIALRCASLHVPDKRPDRDAWIAATALVHGMTVVTRNVADFEQTGVTVFNPWTF